MSTADPLAPAPSSGGRPTSSREPVLPASRAIAAPLLAWHREHGRHALPWQSSGPSPDPYRVWLSEVMLQQTQVVTVIPYFLRFVERWPDVAALAAASLDDVLGAWSGLGYYSRARSLHRAARQVMDRFGGIVPVTAAELVTLPGIGRSTAAAIAAFCACERVAILDGNVRRVLSRVFEVAGDPASAPVLDRLWSLAEAELPADAALMPAYTQAMMDLGATVCTRTRPRCGACPLTALCDANRHGTEALHPSRRVRTARTRLEMTWLLLYDGHSVVVTPRPGRGIWAGLWTLPDADVHDVEPSRSAVEARLADSGLVVTIESGWVQVDTFEHVLTHRDLAIRVLGARVRRGHEGAPDAASAAGVTGEASVTGTTVPAQSRAPDSRAPDAPAARWLALDDAVRAPLPGPLRQRLAHWVGEFGGQSIS